MSVASSNVATTCDSPNFETRQAADGQLDRERDLRLGLLRIERGRGGVDLDLDGRRVGKGVNGEDAQAVAADEYEHPTQHADEQTVLERERDDAAQHDESLLVVGAARARREMRSWDLRAKPPATTT
jgi:hypothetical protein